jgi:hypothetical protein
MKEYFGLDSLDQSHGPSEIRLKRFYNECILFVILRFDKGSWNGFKASLVIQHIEINDNSILRYVPRTTVHVPPSMGWDKFVKKLLEMGLLKIAKEIPISSESNIGADIAQVEYLYNDEYRLYRVESPYERDSPGAKKMAEILKFVEKQLKFKDFYSLDN